MKQKHFIDIQHIREEETDLRSNNIGAFKIGDIIQITEKYDGSNACAAYDPETDTMYAFSRKQELNYTNTLNGFWNFVQTLPEAVINVFKAHPAYRVFGEWSNKNKIVYTDTGKVKHWYVYDIYDTDSEKWLTQDKVKAFCASADLEYIHELYNGPFISWEHCKSFLHSPAYGERQEGVVCKNMSALLRNEEVDSDRSPAYLKIVNDDFKESMKTHERVIDPEKENAKAEAQKIMESIVTKNRIEKELYKMRDEGLIPEKFTNQDMATIARNLPKRIYDDIMKEEKELLIACGEFGGKMCSSITMRLVKEIVLGEE